MQLGARARASLTEGYWQAEPGGFQLAGPRGVGKVEPGLENILGVGLVLRIYGVSVYSNLERLVSDSIEFSVLKRALK